MHSPRPPFIPVPPNAENRRRQQRFGPGGAEEAPRLPGSSPIPAKLFAPQALTTLALSQGSRHGTAQAGLCSAPSRCSCIPGATPCNDILSGFASTESSGPPWQHPLAANGERQEPFLCLCTPSSQSHPHSAVGTPPFCSSSQAWAATTSARTQGRPHTPAHLSPRLFRAQRRRRVRPRRLTPASANRRPAMLQLPIGPREGASPASSPPPPLLFPARLWAGAFECGGGVAMGMRPSARRGACVE